MMSNRWNFVLLLICTISLGLTAAPGVEANDGFETIFDGKSLDGWDGDPKFWRIEDGTLTGQTTADNPTKGNTFLVWRKGHVDDFELLVKFRIVGGNSGIQYRSKEVAPWVIAGYQADIDSTGRFAGILYEEKARGILAHRGKRVVIDAEGKKKDVDTTASEKEILVAIKKEDWNEYRIVAKGNHLIQQLNGKTTVDVTDDQTDKASPSGLLALQLHAGPPMKIQFKDIRLRRLPAASKKVVFVAGNRSHGYGSHEHNAGCLLLSRELKRRMPGYSVVVHQNGWPQDPDVAFADADAVVMYCDGGGGHMVNPHLDSFDKLMKKGVGLACIHYAVEVPKGSSGDAFLDWLGGYFEMHWSVNPHWKASFSNLPKHPITRGVKPFAIQDEWYFHMRFRDQMQGVTPILSAAAPESTMSRKDGPHSGNPHVRASVAKGLPQHVAWATEREDGGRGFGFTGGHFHWNWGDDNFRRLVLNAIVWIAHGAVPESGVTSADVTRSDLEANQDYPKPEKKDDQAAADTTRSPDKAVAGLDVHKDVQATLFAAEPMLLSPSNIDVDHLGRVWVCEVVNYRRNNGKRPEGDRILTLEDTDGDGRLDQQTVFYQGRDVDSALGICVLGNRVIVSVAPNVFVLSDTNGDGKADAKESLFTNVGQPQHDHSAHAFVFGPDGKLYWNFGNTGKQVHDRNGDIVVDKAGNEVRDNGDPYYGGMVFRCNEDGSDFEVLAHNFRNNYEVAVDSFGTLWQSDNDDDGNRGVRFNYVMEFGNYGYRDELTGASWQTPRTGWHPEIPTRHWHQNDPGVVPNLLQTGGGSPSGICVYEGDLLPEWLNGQVIHTDPGPNVVWSIVTEKSGAGYQAKSVNILKGERDPWFRPCDVCVAPDGSLIIADWYDPGVGGHAMGDLERGRLFRVAPPGANYTVPTYNFATADGAVEALKSPNQSVRYLAWKALHGMGHDAEDALLRLFDDPNPRFKARALWLLGKIEGHGQHYVNRAIADANPDIRIAGLRLARQVGVDLIPLLTRLVSDPAAEVRRQCATTLRICDSPNVPGLWSRIAQQYDGRDRWYLEALGIGAHGKWDACLQAWLSAVGNQ